MKEGEYCDMSQGRVVASLASHTPLGSGDAAFNILFCTGAATRLFRTRMLTILRNTVQDATELGYPSQEEQQQALTLPAWICFLATSSIPTTLQLASFLLVLLTVAHPNTESYHWNY